MADRDALAALVERVEAATGPDRKLAGDILRAMGYFVDGWRVVSPEGVPLVHVPDPTDSLDAALSLAMREGFLATLGCIAADGLPGCCICTSTDPVREAWGLSAGGTDPLGRLARAAVAAALRARMEGER